MTNDEPKVWTPSEMGKKGGRSKSDQKMQAIRQNLQKAAGRRKLKPCSCDAEHRPGKFKGLHRSHCPVYKREARAAQKESQP